jgi:predicted alpha/beta superfamily hydrolase
MGTRRTVSIALLLFILLVAGCSSTSPETVIVEQTVISEIPVTVQVTQVAEATLEPVSPVTEVTVPRTETITLHSSASDRDYNIYIALPDGYSFSKIAYPVVYLLDGDITFIMATEYSRWLSSGEALRKTIIVGIDNSRRRSRDLLPEHGGVGEFLTFIQEELVPYVDGNYRTKPMDRTLAGGSDGGLFTLYTLFHTPETFNRYIVTTPSLSRDDLIFKYEEEFASNHSELPVRLFLSVGGREPTIHVVEEFHERLEGRNYAGLDLNMVIIEDAGHVTTFIQGFLDGLQTVFRQ